MEITKRELIASATIIGIMLLIGLAISNRIQDYTRDKNEVYNKAIHIESQDIFEYAMRTNVGNAFVYGDLEAVDTVGYSEIDGEYLYVEKVREEYTMHTKMVSYSCGKKTCYKTETYWTWDFAGSESKSSEKVTFLGVEFNFNQFRRPSDSYLTTIRKGSHVRYKYYVVPSKLTGTIFSELADSSIQDKAVFYDNMTTQQAYDSAVSGGTVTLVVFWVIWVGLTGGLVYGFYYLENDWLY